MPSTETIEKGTSLQEFTMIEFQDHIQEKLKHFNQEVTKLELLLCPQVNLKPQTILQGICRFSTMSID